MAAGRLRFWTLWAQGWGDGRMRVCSVSRVIFLAFLGSYCLSRSLRSWREERSGGGGDATVESSMLYPAVLRPWKFVGDRLGP